jgi:aspartyl-tRNA(Asn)/glutamyl-tRNA(Gln) amidotransferase subunit C
MAISREEVEHVARLARIELTDEETERFREQLSAVLERAQRIQSLELDDVPPTAHPVELRNVLRPDIVVAPEATADILKAAPESEDGFFKAPRILEDED